MDLLSLIPINKRDDVINAFALAYGYEPNINNSPNPETKKQFVARVMLQMLIEPYRKQRVQAKAVQEAEAVDNDLRS